MTLLAVCIVVAAAAGYAVRWFWAEWRVKHHHQRCRCCGGSGVYNPRLAEELRQDIAGRFR
jgi:hypothetical protein